MATEIVMPPLSQTTDEVKLVGWLVKEGDTIQKGDPVCEVETDKVSMEVESFASGRVLKILVEPDTVIQAGTAIAIIGAEGEEVPRGEGTAVPAEVQPVPLKPLHLQRQPASVAPVTLSPVAQDIAAKRGCNLEEVVGTGLGGTVTGKDLFGRVTSPVSGVKVTAIVRNLAQKHGIDLSSVKGTGPGGLITRDDLEGYRSGAPAPVGVHEAGIGLTGNQQAIAFNLSKSKNEIPHYYLKTTVYMDHLLQHRADHPYPDGKRVSVTAFLVKAIAIALSRHPRLNGYFQDNTVHLYGNIGIALAVASGDELYVPVVRDPLTKDIREIGKGISRLAGKVRNGKLQKEDMKGGTFTVSNLGMYPVDEFFAIISPKQAGILAIGRMEKKMVIGDDDTMRIRPAVIVTGSFDHRVVNGVQGAEFLGELKNIIEEEMS